MVFMEQQATRRTKQAQGVNVRVNDDTDRNRRMRNRTYGGVGGRPGQPDPLPDYLCDSFRVSLALPGSVFDGVWLT